MRNRYRLLGCIAATLVACGLSAGADNSAEFAYGWSIETEGTHDYFEVVLPFDVNRAALSPQLWDVAVFNGQGQFVPRFFYQPVAETRPVVRRHPVPVLPLWDDPEQPAAGLNLRVVRGANDEILELSSPPPERVPAGRILTGYVLDIRGLEEAPTALNLRWEPIESTFLGKVSIGCSNRLVSWRVAGGGALAELGGGAERLVHSEVPFHPAGTKFCRLTWEDLPDDWRLIGAEVLIPAEWTRAIDRQELTLTGKRPDDADDRIRVVRDFDAGAALLVDGLQIRLATDNSIASARVHSSSDAVGAGREAHHGIVYRLRRPGEPVFSEMTDIAPVRGRYWRVWLTGAPLDETVEMTLRWRPDRLGFVTQGPGPYILAAGSSLQRESNYPIQKRFDDPALKAFWLDDKRPAGSVGRAVLAPRRTIAGEAAVEPPPRKIGWSSWLLWAILVAAVLLVGWMAWSLSRQLAGGA